MRKRLGRLRRSLLKGLEVETNPSFSSFFYPWRSLNSSTRYGLQVLNRHKRVSLRTQSTNTLIDVVAMVNVGLIVPKLVKNGFLFFYPI